MRSAAASFGRVVRLGAVVLAGLVTLCQGRTSAAAAVAEEAVDRGRLSLAWDAHESGLCEEALREAREVSDGSPSRAEALWIEADCLSSLGRHEEAAAALESPAGRAVADRDRLLADVYWDWAARLTEKEQYADAAAVLRRGLSSVPGEPFLESFRLASEFRGDLLAAVGRGRLGPSPVRLPGGEVVCARRRGDRPSGGRWVQAYPWAASSPWIPDATAEEWMPTLARRLNGTGAALWLKIPAGVVAAEVRERSRRRGLALEPSAVGPSFRLEAERLPWDEAEWGFRAAAEGLGARGAAQAAVARAEADLRGRARLAGWIGENRGSLELRREGTLLLLTDPRTGRRHDLDLDAWSGTLSGDGGEWSRFWADLTAELARPAGSFRCFCGRQVVLRESLVAPEAAKGGGVVAEKGPGYVLTLTALCPLHQQTVTDELLRDWDIDLKAAWDRARSDAVAKPWDVSFERGRADGVAYLALEGEGVSSLARRPALLLGALEAVEGREVRGTSVSVLAPTATSLVIVGGKAPGDRVRAAGTRVLLRGARRGFVGTDRVGYRATLRLPKAAVGVFDMHSTE